MHLDSPTSLTNTNNHHHSFSNNIDAEATEKLLPMTVVNFKSIDSVESPTTHKISPTASPEHKLAQLSSRTSMSIKEEEDEDTVELRNSTSTPHQQESQTLTPTNSATQLLQQQKRLSDGSDTVNAPITNSNNTHASLTPKSSLSLPNNNDDALSASGSEGNNSTGGVTAHLIENPIGNNDSSPTANGVVPQAATTNATSTAATTTTTATSTTAATGTTTLTTANTSNNLLVTDIPEAKSRRKLSVQGKLIRK